jgi:hypothetical protein
MTPNQLSIERYRRRAAGYDASAEFTMPLRLRTIARLESSDEIFDWIREEAGTGSAVAAVDAPLVICNASGIRAAERELNGDYRRFHAGCHAANLGRPFAQNVIAFSRRLEELTKNLERSTVWNDRSVRGLGLLGEDDELLLAAPQQGTEAFVLQAVDGTLLGRRKVPRAADRFTGRCWKSGTHSCTFS